MDTEHADDVSDTIAFIRARFNDDLEGAQVLLDANDIGILMGLVDMNLAFVKFTAGLLGVSEECFLESMTKVGGWMRAGRV